MNQGTGIVFNLLQRFIFSRAGSSLIGLGCVSALIWYAGPAVGLESALWRLGIILGLVALYLLIAFGRWLVARRRGARLQAELAGQGDSRASERAAEIESIRQKMDEAIASLKGSELGTVHRGTAALYALPWYMVIGPSAAGKSTLLRNSGLHFPYANAEDLHLKGFGGTRNCDWWFSDQAILLDTAGRYTTEEDDREEWLTFLGLLRKHRPRLPINGVIVSISVADLLTCDSEGLERHVQILRERIHELMKHLGLVFPVFIVFTKCDLIRGFEAFFEDMSEQERAQVWGAYLFEASEHERRDPAGLFEARMAALHRKLCELRLRKLSMQRNLERKAVLFDFPNQFAAAADRLTGFIQLLFRANPYQETPCFAGVYFTSGTQEGTPLQRLLGNLRQAFGMSEERAPRSAPPKPYFIRSLFTDVVFQLQTAARKGRRRLLLERGLKAASVAAACAALGSALVLLSGAFTSNSLDLRQGTERVAALRAHLAGPRSDGEGEYQALANLLARHQALAEQGEGPLASRLLISTGTRQREPLEAILTDGLERSLRERALPALERQLEDRGREWQAADPADREQKRQAYYQALRAYLMVTSETARLDPEAAAAVLTPTWTRSLGLAEAEEAGQLVRFYLARASAWSAKPELVRQSRAQLRTEPSAEQLYAQIKSRSASHFPSQALDQLLSAPNRGQLGSVRKLPGLYTAAAWHGFVRDQIDQVVTTTTTGDWVLAEDDGDAAAPVVVDEALAARLRPAIRELYFQDYADAWLEFIGSVRPTAVGSLPQASSQLAILARSDGPVGELMSVAAANLRLTERPLPPVPQTKPAEGAKPAAAEAITQAAGQAIAQGAAAVAAVAPVEPEEPVAELQRWLGDLQRVAEPAPGKSVSEPLDHYLLVLAGLRGEVERLAVSGDRSRDCLRYAANMVSDGGANTQLYRGWMSTTSVLNSVDGRTRLALQGLLETPTRAVWQLIVAEARTELERAWQREVAAVFQAQLQGKFPFSASGPDATVDDVAEYFRPEDGVLWGFVREELAPFLVESRRGWQERRWLHRGIGFSPAFLRSLDDARTITAGLFKRDGGGPEMSFYVYPVPVPGLSEMVLESHGQAYRYRNEPQEWRRFSWPGGGGQISARVVGVVSRGSARAELAASGPWALFHLLRDARLTHEGGAVYLSEWELNAEGYGPITVSFRIRADRQQSVFQQRLPGYAPPASPFGVRTVAEAR